MIRLRSMILKGFAPKLMAALVLFCSVSALNTYALTVGAMFDIGNLAFQPNRASTDTTFPGTYYPWGISVIGSQQISDTMSINTGFLQDTVLRNIAYTTVTFQSNYFSVGAGPSLGVFNSTASPLTPGIETSVRIQIPGIVYLSYGGDSTLGSSLVQTGDYLQQRSSVSLGFYIPNAIASANILTKKYTDKTAAGSTIDQLTLYSFQTDIYQKNVPYRVNLTFGYQTLSKTYVAGSTTTVAQLGSIIVGTRLNFRVSDLLNFVADLNSSVYTFGQKALVGLSNPGPNGYLFHLQTGVQVNLDSILKHR